MPSNHRVESQPDQKNGHKPEPAAITEQGNEFAAVTELAGGLLGTNADGVQNQAAQLRNTRIQTIQRQQIATQIGQKQGNLHLQRVIQRQTDEVAGPAALIAEDDAETLQPGQMRKSEFLAQLKEASCAVADEALSGTMYSTVGCPYIAKVFGKLPGYPSAKIERMIRTYAPEAAGATTAAGYISPITNRVRVGIARWLESGEIPALPKDLSDNIVETPTHQGAGGVVNRRMKDSPQHLYERVSNLGPGRPLDYSTRSRIEAGLGGQIEEVSIHAGGQASQLAQSEDARAFTIGNHIVFGEGEYKPGTPVGDAILVHELAHVTQQRDSFSSTNETQRENAADSALEEDANRSTIGTIRSLWGRAQGRVKEIAENAGPRLRSGLSLRRCPAAGVGAAGAFLYVMLRPNTANAPGPGDKTYESVSELQVAGEAMALFVVPTVAYEATAAKLGFYGASALAGGSGAMTYRGVEDIGKGEFSGFKVYLLDATTGAVIGVVVPGGIRLAGKAGTKSLDWLATQGVTRSDLAITRTLARQSAKIPIAQSELGALLQPRGWTGKASHWWMERRGFVILYRGQGVPTPEILSPLAREQGVAASEALVARMKAAGLTDDEIAGFVARWHTEPVPEFLTPPGSGLGGERLGSVGIPTTRLPGVAAQSDFGAKGMIYTLRVPQGSAIKVPQWGLSAENEWVILNKLPEGSIVGKISPASVPALTVDEAGRLVPAQ